MFALSNTFTSSNNIWNKEPNLDGHFNGSTFIGFPFQLQEIQTYSGFDMKSVTGYLP